MLEKPIEKGFLNVANSIKTSTAIRTEFVGVYAGKKGNFYQWVRFDFSSVVKDKILDQHYPSGTNTAGKGIFDGSTSIDSLVSEARRVVPRWQDVSDNHRIERLQWIVDAGERVGQARVGTRGDFEPTNIYTVITELDGQVVTAHPGIPRIPTKIGPKYDLLHFSHETYRP